MKKPLLYIAGALVITVIILLIILQKPQRRFDGRITLNSGHTLPYGSKVAYRLLQQQFPGATISVNKNAPGQWNLPAKDTSGSLLFVLTYYFNPTDEELDSITAFVQKGNSVFISAWLMDEKAQHFFGIKQSETYNPLNVWQSNRGIKIKDTFSLHLNTTLFAQPATFYYPGVAYDNRFKQFDSSYTYPLGYDRFRYPNLLAINALKGTFFLHSAPVAFTNLFLLYGNNHLYFEKLISLLPADTKHILWDDYFMYHQPDVSDDNNSVLYVLLKYDNFRWAFWLTLIALALYTLTEVKRRQRFTPGYTPPVNDTLTFVSTVGKLYFEKGDHKNLADKLSVYFLDYIRNKYKVVTTEINPEFVRAVSAKSNVPQDEITKITDTLTAIKLSDVITQQQLINYYKLLENFYSKT